MRILYAETSAYAPSSAHFLEAFEAMAARGALKFAFLDEAKYLRARPSIAYRIARRVTGRPPGYRALNVALVAGARRLRPDLVLVGKGAWYSPAALREVRESTGAVMVNWATDDPFNPANGSHDLAESIRLYDLYVCTRRAAMADVERAGCRNVAYVRFGYKPEVHFPQSPATAEEERRFGCDVVFIGGCDRDRAPYFEALVRALPEIRLNLFGGYWGEVPALARYWRGVAVGRDFRLAIGGAKIAINLVRRANRDDHVMRTFEVPACGGFMLTERTPAHEEIFGEDREAAFFSSPGEMAAKVRDWLARDEARRAVAAAGHRKVTTSHNTYADRLAEILDLSRPLMKERAALGPTAHAVL
ncbi:MAG TPA: glycosyltransferase [Candidatus Binataceae bacterium]|nr:glycosyltransferase [Candidatus Binataceae bacterium]